MSHCGAVVKEMLERVDKPGSTPGDAVFCFFVPFFLSIWSLFFLHYFFFWPFFLYSYCWPCWSCTWINIYFKLKSGVLFWKRDFKSLIYILAKLMTRKKTISSQDMFLLWNSWMFSNVSWHHWTNNTQYTTKCTNLHPTPSSDPLAKVKVAFCTSSKSLILLP